MFSRAPLLSRLKLRLFGRSKREQAAAETLQQAQRQPESCSQVHMSFLNGSFLAVGVSPTFRFQPESHPWYRTAVGEVLEVQGQQLHVKFDVDQHKSPPMSWSTTYLQAFWPLRVPALPPGITIEMDTKELQGWIDLGTGEVDLSFVSEFDNRALGAHISAEPLKVEFMDNMDSWWSDICSRMTTNHLSGQVFHACGELINFETAKAKLVALSLVPKTGDRVQDTLLGLPVDALSVLNVQLSFHFSSKKVH